MLTGGFLTTEIILQKYNAEQKEVISSLLFFFISHKLSENLARKFF